ncbi:MAG: ABC transporter permease, partial [Bacteroidota bacterium]
MTWIDFRLAFRTLKRERGYAAINLVGLAVGLACSLFILLYVQDEWQYDQYHEDAEHIYRVHGVDEDGEFALTPTIVAPLFVREFPEVQAATRIDTRSGVVRYEQRLFEERNLFFVDSTFFDVFTHAFVHGGPEQALTRPRTMVLTASTAQRYFGDENPVGRTVLVNNASEYEVTGVVEDVPLTSHYQFDILASFASRTYWAENEVWDSANFYTYVRVSDAEAGETLAAKIPELIARREAAGDNARQLALMPLLDIHLFSEVPYELDPTGSIGYVLGFLTIGLLLLLIACINYMNLATARSMRRAREVGVRKAVGALRGQLAGQFYGESVLLVGISLVMALALVVGLLPFFNDLTAKGLTVGHFLTPGTLGLIAAVGLLVSLMAGSYPALVLSRFEPAAVLRGGVHGGRGGKGLRKLLVVAQFGISTVLIAGTAVVVSQLQFLQEQNLGFDKEHVVVMPLNDRTLRGSRDVIKADLLRSPAIRAASAINQVPGNLGWTSGIQFPGASADEWQATKGLPADADVVDGLGLTVIAGRAFPDSPPLPDSTNSNFQFIINETLAGRGGWTPEEAVGQRIQVDSRTGTIIGVVADFHFQSLREAIEPLTIWYDPDQTFNLAVRLTPGSQQAALAHLEATWAVHAAHRPFAYRFLDDVYDRLYRNEQQMGRLAGLFSGLAIFIACLGLLGLAA